MNRDEVFNFSAGPSVLPDDVLRRAAGELSNYACSGMSVMEMSHRSSIYQEIFDAAKAKLKKALSVPDTHEVLFLQGGASTQFSMVPLNLIGENGSADYAVTGSFSTIAMMEAKKFGRVNVAVSSEGANHTYIPRQNEIICDPAASYFFYCSNNTVFGTQWDYVPETCAPLVCDMSSDILSKPIDCAKYGLIFAGAQKNMAPAGVTVCIIDKTIAGRELPFTPLMLSYKLMIDKDSMYNTPPTYNIYMLSLVLDWVEQLGGVEAMSKRAAQRSDLLYDYLDNSRLFSSCARPDSRSAMNITFRAGDDALDAEFIKTAASKGFLNLKGHRLTGGMRASCYNAMPIDGVRKLVELMKKFEVEHNV